MRNIALILMYNGAAYHGWQVQKTETSVAQTLERGLSMVCGEPNYKAARRYDVRLDIKRTLTNGFCNLTM